MFKNALIVQQAERAARHAQKCTYESMRIADPSFPFGFGGIYFDFVNFWKFKCVTICSNFQTEKRKMIFLENKNLF